MRVLIVDDEPAVRLSLKMALSETNHAIDSVASAEEALVRLNGPGADILIVDKNLPGMNGIELLKAARAISPPPWALMITGYASAESAAETLELGVYGYLEKPFEDIYQVVERVEQVARLKGAVDKLGSWKGDPVGSGEPLLVVTRDDAEGTWITAELQTDEVKVMRALSLDEAVSRARSSQPLLCVLDDRVDAALLDLVQQVRAAAPRACFVVLYDKPALSLVTRLIDLGCVKAVLQRPLAEAGLRTRVHWVLRTLRERPHREERA